MEVVSNSAKETREAAADLAKKIIKSKPGKHAVVAALEGELGAGKTTFAQGFARALGIKSRITSPTFVLIKDYKLWTMGHRHLIHIDAYRLKGYKDLENLEVKEMIADPKNIILIEWSDRVKEVLPKNYIKIHIDHIDKNTRKIRLQIPSTK